MQDVLQLILLMFIFLAVVGMAYIATKKMALVSKGMSQHKNMQIVEILPMLQGQYLYIVKIGEKYHLFSVSAKGNITYCKEIAEDELNLEEPKVVSFKEQLNDFVKGKQVKSHDKK